MEFMKKYRIQSDCKISISVHHFPIRKLEWICWLLRHYLNYLCELNFIGQQIFNVSP